ncbi:uncharacterized [Tachysurus ichikawai]
MSRSPLFLPPTVTAATPPNQAIGRHRATATPCFFNILPKLKYLCGNQPPSPVPLQLTRRSELDLRLAQAHNDSDHYRVIVSGTRNPLNRLLGFGAGELHSIFPESHQPPLPPKITRRQRHSSPGLTAVQPAARARIKTHTKKETRRIGERERGWKEKIVHITLLHFL